MKTNDGRDRGPAEVDYLNISEVIRYIRDLLNMSAFLERGFDSELLDFEKKLELVGWGKDRIRKFVTMAGHNTIYEQSLPHPIPNAGDWREWLKIKAIHK